MAKYLAATFIVFVASAIWLFMAWSGGNKTKSWVPTTAKILKNDMSEIRGEYGRTQPAGWLTTISYTVGGNKYETVVDEYLVGSEATVFVDPNDPTRVVGKSGATVQAMGRPLLATIGSGLFGVLLLLIGLSPKDD